MMLSVGVLETIFLVMKASIVPSGDQTVLPPVGFKVPRLVPSAISKI